jgi:RNA polymerase sigma factor (sigma-70 family)
MTVDQDAQLAAEGDVEAFEKIYRRHHKRVFSLCFRMVKNVSEAEDLTQEVFVQLFRKIGSFRGDSAFSTWLHRLTVNQVLMHFRRRSVKNERTSEDGEMPEQTVTGSANPNRKQVIDRIQIKCNRFGFEPEVTAKVAKLRPRLRIYEVGVAYYGRSYEEGKKITWKDGVKAILAIIRFITNAARIFTGRSVDKNKGELLIHFIFVALVLGYIVFVYISTSYY